VAETKHDGHSDYQTLIRLTITTQKGTSSVSGTLFAGEKPRIVSINGVNIEAEVSPHMLYVRNEDKPGFVGKLGSTLGDAGINIATFHLGRNAPGEDAIVLVSVDQPVSEALLQTIAALPRVVRAKALEF
jgi:D-3-phosphoglycerate dehydrogenase